MPGENTPESVDNDLASLESSVIVDGGTGTCMWSSCSASIVDRTMSASEGTCPVHNELSETQRKSNR